MKKVNFLGTTVGLLFLGLAALFFKWSQTDKDRGVMQGIFLFSGIGIFFIYQSLKGKNTSTIFKTDVGAITGVGPGESYLTYLKWIGIVIVVSIVLIFVWTSLSFKSYNPNSWQNKLACLIHYNCINQNNLEPTTFSVYSRDAQNYTYDNYGFYFTYPTGWQVNYRKETSSDNKGWDFSFSPLANSQPKDASDLSTSGNMYIKLHPSISTIAEYLRSNPLQSNNTAPKQMKIGNNSNSYKLSVSTNSLVYVVLGSRYSYEISFSNDTPIEVQNKIIKYLIILGYFN